REHPSPPAGRGGGGVRREHRVAVAAVGATDRPGVARRPALARGARVRQPSCVRTSCHELLSAMPSSKRTPTAKTASLADRAPWTARAAPATATTVSPAWYTTARR